MTDEPSFYSRLAARFERHETVNGFTTITAEQVISRLNEVLGYDGWSFSVKDHGLNTEADEIWALGRLEIYRADGVTIVREQFGSAKIKRFSRGDNQGKLVDLGHDLMGAATTSLKKCASLIGVGLYLSVKANSNGQARGTQGNQSRPAQQNSSGQAQAQPSTGAPIVCAECGDPLKGVKFKDETEWTAVQLANAGVKKFGKPLCRAHFWNT